jgi:hypothetical protein
MRLRAAGRDQLIPERAWEGQVGEHVPVEVTQLALAEPKLQSTKPVGR